MIQNRGNVFLIGFMGSGKTTIGRLLAQELGWDFIDLDEMIERREGISIENIFDTHGEAYFRRVEMSLLKEIVSKSRTVIALGGGTVTQNATWPLLRRNGVVVYLRCRVDELHRRLQDDNTRPLLRRMPPEQRLQRIEELLVLREPFYRRADFVVDSTSYQRPKDVAETVCAVIREKF
jgi:shikimate kinase